jgi:hypothetical protein
MAQKTVFFPPGQRAFIGVETPGAMYSSEPYDDISEVQHLMDEHDAAVDEAAEEAAARQLRAIEYGAKDLYPIRKGEYLEWPADEDRVALDRITYHPEDDMFSGWQCGRPVPEWTQH